MCMVGHFCLIARCRATQLKLSCEDYCYLQGLALPALAKDAWQMPAFFRMVQQGILRDPVFSVWMDPDSNAVPAGEILFGGADASRFEGHLQLIPVISKK